MCYIIVQGLNTMDGATKMKCAGVDRCDGTPTAAVTVGTALYPLCAKCHAQWVEYARGLSGAPGPQHVSHCFAPEVWPAPRIR
jgi:hypothetical protein